MQTFQVTFDRLDLFSYIGGFSGAAGSLGTEKFDPKTSLNGALADPVAFAKRVHLLWLGVGTEEPANMHKGHNLWLRQSLALLMVISFYPLARAYALGQAQIFLDLVISLGFLILLEKQDGLSGFVIGFSVLVKPQYGLFLLWAAIRKNGRFFFAAAIPVIGGTALSLLLYGWKNNVQYLDVLQYMSSHGEAYFANQSTNGLLNRLLQSGSNVVWEPHRLAPFLPAVYVLTLITSAILITLALFPKNRGSGETRISEFALVAIAATAASPIVWEHHDGVLLPVFAWALSQAALGIECFKYASALVIPFILCADDWRITNLLAGLVLLVDW